MGDEEADEEDAAEDEDDLGLRVMSGMCASSCAHCEGERRAGVEESASSSGMLYMLGIIDVKGIFAARREGAGEASVRVRPQSVFQFRRSRSARNVPRRRVLKARGEHGLRGMGETERMRKLVGRTIGESDPRSKKEPEELEDVEEVEAPRR